MALLRRLALCTKSRASPFALTSAKFGSSASLVSSTSETYVQKTWRWLDVMGWLTRWHSRRAWILDADPPQRASLALVTEYERKLLLWLTWVNFFFLPISLWYWWGQFTHLASKPPCPLMPEYQYMNGRKRDFSFHGGRWNDCKECRWLEFECKKMCHDRLREEGREVWGLSRPRTQTIGTV
eukprot:TRINITY_DN274_c0_g1_i7.p1 TRINITY_DN274_c0_g1~~TRINITY_DN274_c0_g1_i7.p1  ORF type:complete len:182 (-),score=24.01 TRINITY_DN274_c0_g1_i7:149-694(-)